MDAAVLATAAVPFDLVVLRYPAEAVTVAFELSELPGFISFTADHLCYWEWQGAGAEAVVPPGWSVDDQPSGDEVTDVVRDSFASYRNHYSANPLLDRSAALEGYCEWAGHLAAADGAALLLRDQGGEGVGVALIDWLADRPEVRLAGMRSSAQGQGLYRVLIESVVERAVAQGHSRVLISTQSHNVNVMRAWARMGFVPAKTIATQHLLRAELVT
ncbi:MAG: GNAT family N-acetyltransferase [Ilumatobacter sp.]